MKKMRKIIPLTLMVFILSIVGTITASAAKLGDAYSWYGVQIGWVFIIIAIIVGFFVWAFLSKSLAKKLTLPLVLLVAIGLVLAVTDVAPEAEITEITPGVTWTSTATEHQGGNITIDNDANSIIIMCHVNSTAGTMLDDDDTAFTAPILNFTVSPTITEGLTDLTLGATTLASVISPEQAFTVSGTSYDLYADVSGTTGDKDLLWTADGTDQYEFHYVTVQFGSSEVAQLDIVYNPAGISQLSVGTIKSSTISIAGTTYTVSLIITGIIT